MRLRDLLTDTLLFSGTLLALLLPFPWKLLPLPGRLTPALLGPLLGPLARRIDPASAALPVSDSLPQLLLVVLLAIVALLAALLLNRSARWQKFRLKVQPWLRSGLSLFLAAVLLRYGCEKLLKAQFYLPEPNTLYTPLGMLDRDLLYWSTVSTSYSYNLFLGGTEALAALLLFFRRTRRAGLLLAAGTFIQVLAVNICFGITVILFSSFLLFLSLLLLAPDLRRIWSVLSGSAVAALPVPGRPPLWAVVAKTFIGLLLLAEALYAPLASGYWNDDRAPRPPLHGAYAVLPGSGTPVAGIPAPRRLFVHRAGYFVLQDSSEGIRSFPLRIDTVAHVLEISIAPKRRTTYAYSYDVRDSLLSLRDERGTVILRAHALNWRQLPALR